VSFNTAVREMTEMVQRIKERFYTRVEYIDCYLLSCWCHWKVVARKVYSF